MFEVDLVGVDDPVGLSGAESTVRAYLLAAPRAVSTEWVRATEGGTQVQKLRISWQDGAVWLPKDVPNLAHVVYASAGPGSPLGEVLGAVPLGQGGHLDVVPPADAAVVAVALADGFANQGPGIVGIIAAPAVATPAPSSEDAALAAMKAALDRLGYRYEMWQAGKDTPGTVQRKYRGVVPAGWEYGLYTVLKDTGAL